MKAILPKENLVPWLEKLAESLEVIAPIEVGGEAVFATWRGEALNLKENSKASPVEVLLPKREVLFSYAQDCGQYTFEEPTPSSRVAVGIKPCDLRAISILDKIFGSEPADQPYLARRRATILVALNCTEPGPGCFCYQVRAGPVASEDFDLALTDLGPCYLAETGSAAGVLLVKGHWNLFLEADESHEAQREDMAEKARLAMEATYGDRSVEHLRGAIRSADWDALGKQCLSCGGCSFICPVCHCFTIADLGVPDGERIRCRDSCIFSGFSRMTSGGNPMGRIGDRIKNWYLEKFEHLPERIGMVGCVGCGRCGDVCLAEIDRWKLEVLV